MISACIVIAEAARLDVGRGVAVMEHEVAVEAEAACSVDFGAALLAREEGRGPPERIAWRIDVDGALAKMGGPLGAAAIEVAVGRHRVRVRAAMRGERFVSAPLSLDANARHDGASFSARATSVWGAFGIAGVARWIDVGVPIVVRIDPARDHEPLTSSTRVVDSIAPVFVVDAGPMLGGAPSASSQEDRSRDLAAGGARALSVLLEDLPVAIATAADDATAIVRLRDAARAALAASRSIDPLTVAVGQRLTTAIATAFTSCLRDERAHVPIGWPPTPSPFVATGLLEDAEAGCPRIAGLLTADHPKLPIDREATAALEEALADARIEPPVRVGSIERGSSGRPLHRIRRGRFALVVAAFASALAALLIYARARRASE